MDNQILKYSLCICLLICVCCVAAHAQILPPPAPGNGGGANVPLDPVSWTILAAGGAYAYRKYRSAKTEQED